MTSSPLPDRRYNVIYADPPWEYEQSHRLLSAKNEYDVMPLEEIKAMSVKELADSPCLLFLWATSPKLSEALQVIEAWGFRYITIAFVWNKIYDPSSSLNTFPKFLGAGLYTRPSCELCLLGGIGQTTKLIKNRYVSQLVKSRRLKHSEKPHVVRENIVKLVGDIPRIELFARHKVIGWDQWGDQVPQEVKPLESFI